MFFIFLPVACEALSLHQAPLNFFSDIIDGGGNVQVCTKWKGLLCSKDVDAIEKTIASHPNDDLYFVAGVSPELGINRASDSDVCLKSFFYVDIDVRKQFPGISDTELTTSFLQDTIATLAEHEWLKEWRYIVCSGNGYQVYYFGKTPATMFHGDIQFWTAGVQQFYKYLEEKTGIVSDAVCANPARLARCPGSFNHKSTPPKPANVLCGQDVYLSKFDNILQDGQNYVQKKREEQAVKTELIQSRQASTGTTAYDKINSTDIKDVVQKLLGWDIVPGNGKTYFMSPGGQRKSACYVRDGENFLVHGGTHEFSDFGLKAFSPFNFVKFVGDKSNRDTFFWFRDNFSVGSDEQSQPQSVQVKHASIKDVFNKLKKTDFTLLKLGNSLDRYDLFMRKIVVRIGALSFTGKSKVGYWLVNLLCKQGYSGYIFSTEVTSERVLAELLHQEHPTSLHAKQILRGEVEISEDLLEPFKHLGVYDSSTTDNSLTNIEHIIEQGFNTAISEGKPPPAFALIDFVQMVQPKGRAGDDFRAASLYASEIQTIAQKYNICIIDLSQLNADGMKDTWQSQGYIPFMNGRALYSNADVAIMLKRDRSAITSNHTTFSVRKHKYGDPVDVFLEYNFNNGMFNEFEPKTKGGDILDF